MREIAHDVCVSICEVVDVHSPPVIIITRRIKIENCHIAFDSCSVCRVQWLPEMDFRRNWIEIQRELRCRIVDDGSVVQVIDH